MSLSLVITHAGAAAEVFAPTLEVLKQDDADKATALVQASTFDITDTGSFAKANDMATVMHALEKKLDARHEFLKRPLLDTTRLVKAAVEGVVAPLSSARKSLIGKIAAWDKKQKDAAVAAQLKAKQEAEAQQAEAQRIANEEHAARVKAANEEATKQAKDLEEILGKPVEVQPAAVAPAVMVAPIKPAPIVAPLPPSAVTTRTVAKLVITDPRKIAAAYQVGMEILVRLDEAAIKRAIEAGAIVEGAYIEMVETVAMRGVRS